MLADPKSQLYYPFQNTLIDGSGHGRNGTLDGSPACTFVAGGPRGRALYFPGTGYVVTPSFGLSGTVVVFAAWVRCKQQAAMNQPPIGDNAALSGIVGFLYTYRAQASDDLVWRYANGSTTTNATATGFFTGYDDVWVHLCEVADYAGKNVYFYRKGVLLATVGMTTPVFPSTNRVKYLGEYAPGHASIITDGYMADVYLGTLATAPTDAARNWNAKRLAMGLHPIW